jgi:hypothetical protein
VPAPGLRGKLQRALSGRPVEPKALARAVRDACGTWDRSEELVNAIVAGYRGGA